MIKDHDPQSDAEAIAREFKFFAYSVSHDLSAPIRGMVEFSKLLKAEQSGALNDEGKLYLSLIIESGEKLQSMLAGLLKYSQLDIVPNAHSVVPTHQLVNHCQSILKEKIEAASARITIDPLPVLYGNKEQIEQLFCVLMENALLYQSSGNIPAVHIAAQPTAEGNLFTVRDNGIGIPREFHEHIFQPFKRLHSDKEYPGVGIGLALAKKIVDQHAGRIWIENSSDAGTSVQFILAPRAMP